MVPVRPRFWALTGLGAPRRSSRMVERRVKWTRVGFILTSKIKETSTGALYRAVATLE
jgi:hypothetical protein